MCVSYNLSLCLFYALFRYGDVPDIFVCRCLVLSVFIVVSNVCICVLDICGCSHVYNCYCVVPVAVCVFCMCVVCVCVVCLFVKMLFVMCLCFVICHLLLLFGM